MNNIVGNILRELLNEKGSPSKRDFSEMLGISPKTLYNVFEGNSELTLSQITKASNILNVDIILEYRKRTGETNTVEEPLIAYNSKPSITMTFNFSLPQNKIENVGLFLKDLNQLTAKHSIKIL